MSKIQVKKLFSELFTNKFFEHIFVLFVSKQSLSANKRISFEFGSKQPTELVIKFNSSVD